MNKREEIEYSLYLPAEFSRERVVDVISSALKSGNLNLGLFFDKYIFWEGRKNDKYNDIKCSIKTQMEILEKINKDPREAKYFLKNGNKGSPARNLRHRLDLQYFPLTYYEMYRKRMELITDNLEKEGYYIEYLPNRSSGMPLKWRLAINLGRSSVYEISYLFHRNYSIPYIPGSAVKGVTRHWAIQKFSDNNHHPDELEKALENGEEKPDIKAGDISFSDLVKIFGSKNEKGKVVFFNAIPYFDYMHGAKNSAIYVLDAMNVHYFRYYQGGLLPRDRDNPRPIFFLAIEKGVNFRFALASRNRDLAVKAKALLKEAISKLGVGAKTSAGYGYFEAVQI